MRIGIDFDNTLVCYDAVFHRAALERGWITEQVSATKHAVRSHLRSNGNERGWIELQGWVYGSRIAQAELFEGAAEFLHDVARRGDEVVVISHKTRLPHLGPRVDLHAAARQWLVNQGLLVPSRTGLRVFFEETREQKIDRIGTEQCDIFVDDLPEFLSDPVFPAQVLRVLFDPRDEHPDDGRYRRLRNWLEIAGFVSQGWRQAG